MAGGKERGPFRVGSQACWQPCSEEVAWVQLIVAFLTDVLLLVCKLFVNHLNGVLMPPGSKVDHEGGPSISPSCKEVAGKVWRSLRSRHEDRKAL